MITLPFDVAYQALGPDHGVILSGDQQRSVSAAEAVPALIEAARTGAPAEALRQAQGASPSTPPDVQLCALSMTKALS